jgi:hypothetical protein
LHIYLTQFISFYWVSRVDAITSNESKIVLKVYSYKFKGTPDPTPDQSPFWPYFALIYSHFSLFTHGCSVWFTCFLAFYRYITVTACVSRGQYTQQANTILNKNRIHYFMLALVLMVFACMSFNVLSYDIQKGIFYSHELILLSLIHSDF